MRIRTFRLTVLPLLAACAATQPPPPDPPAATTEAPRRLYTMQDLRLPETVVEAPRETRSKPGPRPSRAESRRQVARANEAGLELPALTCFRGKTCEYWYAPERQYLVYMAAGNQTLVCLKPGEVVLDVVAPGAQVWIPHSVFAYGQGSRRTDCVAFMPRRAGLDHQVSIFTDARKYDLRVETWTKTRHVEVRWRYPEDVLAALNRGGQPVEQRQGGRTRDRATGLDTRSRWCGYEIAGAIPPWRPVPTADGQPPVCDDGEVTVINFAPGTLGGQGAPVLWRVEADGTRMPVQYGRLNATYRIAGLHDHLLLGLGAVEVHIRRRAP